MNQNKVALITGGSSGIGRETAKLFAAAKYTVFVGSRRLGPAEQLGNGIRAVTLDVTNEQSVREAVSAVLAEAGHIHVRVNAAGYWLFGGVEETNVDEARQQFETNFFGTV